MDETKEGSDELRVRWSGCLAIGTIRSASNVLQCLKSRCNGSSGDIRGWCGCDLYRRRRLLRGNGHGVISIRWLLSKQVKSTLCALRQCWRRCVRREGALTARSRDEREHGLFGSRTSHAFRRGRRLYNRRWVGDPNAFLLRALIIPRHLSQV